MTITLPAHADYPVYEIGEHGMAYGDEHKVTPASLGLPHGPAVWPDQTVAGRRQYATVPVALLRASQRYVYAPHVHNLATVPAAVLETAHEWEPVEVLALRDGTYLIGEGHHRAVAALLRGETTILVYISGTEA